MIGERLFVIDRNTLWINVSGNDIILPGEFSWHEFQQLDEVQKD